MASNDFFLSPDDAQTMGDINFMRKSVRVRHTFPKNLKNPDGFEIVKEVSSSEEQTLGDLQSKNFQSSPTQSSFTSSTTQSKTSSSSTSSNSGKKNVDTSLNMFRNMARNLRKR